MNHGHYVAHCWNGGDRYVQVDDAHVSAHDWSQLRTEKVKEDAYILVYVRVSYWNDIVGDATETTPYLRDPCSERIASACFRGVQRSVASEIVLEGGDGDDSLADGLHQELVGVNGPSPVVLVVGRPRGRLHLPFGSPDGARPPVRVVLDPMWPRSVTGSIV